MRIVSLTCSNTEIVCALGCSDQLVGVDDHSDFPEAVVTALPTVGKDLDVDPEKVAALRPDLVLASLTVPGHEKVVERIDATGLRWIAPAPVSLEDVYRDIHTLAGHLGVPERADTLVAQMRAAIVPVAAERRPRVLVEWWPKPVIVPGKRSWVTDLITAAGGHNPLQDRDVESTPITDEEAVACDPDAVVISWCGVPTHKYRPSEVHKRTAWQGISALRADRVHCIAEAYLGRPGPRLVQGYRALRDVVQGCSGT
ncbi:MAG: ABC transporter substrate-binding protein [Myxococcales bacterium]|nr:ABC transporter substrate-binding protein [Myxococcales bacterium]